MNTTHTARCCAILGTMAASQPMSGAVLDAYVVGFFSKVGEAEAQHAVTEALRTCKFRPSVAELWEIVYSLDGRPTAEEAWAMCPKGEEASAVWTDEMAQAAGVVHDLIVRCDLIGARKAFLDAYTRQVSHARREMTPVRWSPTLGTDPMGHTAALASAVEHQRISSAHAARLLPADDTGEFDARVTAAIAAMKTNSSMVKGEAG